MLGHYRRIAKLLVLGTFIYFFCVVRRQVLFEKLLKTSLITFDDFPSNYSKALIEAQREGTPLNYTWPRTYRAEPKLQKTIPPIIHFIWFPNLYHEHLDVSNIPTAGSNAPDFCRAHNPDFEIRMWNDSEARALLEEHYAWFLPTYNAYKYPIQRVDAIKYFVLWHYGGIYMDLDISCRRPLDPLLSFSSWYPKASLMGINNDLMASRARHPLLGLMLKELRPRNKNFIFPYITIFWSTGPKFTSDMLERWWFDPREQQDARTIGEGASHLNLDMVYILPQEFYSETYTFFGHRPGGTWYGEDVATVLWLVDHPWLFILTPMVILFLALAALRFKVLRSLKARPHGRRFTTSETDPLATVSS